MTSSTYRVDDESGEGVALLRQAAVATAAALRQSTGQSTGQPTGQLTGPLTGQLRGVRLELLPRLGAAGEARRVVRDECARAGAGPDATGVGVLLASELVTNAVLHAGTAVTLRVDVDGDLLRVEVQDGAPAAPVVRRCVSPTAESGRGLGIVDAMAQRWGVRPVPGGKAVWFELRLAG